MASKLILILFPKKIVGIRLLRSIWGFSFQAQILHWIKSLFSHLGTTKGTFWHFRTKKLSLEIDLWIFISSANPALSKIIIFPPWYYEGYFFAFSDQKIVGFKSKKRPKTGIPRISTISGISGIWTFSEIFPEKRRFFTGAGTTLKMNPLAMIAKKILLNHLVVLGWQPYD